MTAALELTNVDVHFGGRRSAAAVEALSNISLTVEAGERVAVVGRSGAGKSTIARLACGLTAPTSGSVRSLGTDLGQLSRSGLRRLRRRMHLVFQDPYKSLHPGMTIGDIVAEPLHIEGVGGGSRQPVAEALASVGLSPAEQFIGRNPASLSGGQRQRVAIARALVAKPELILADEPTSMLDASLRATMSTMLLDLQRAQNAAMVFITHDLALARQVSDRIVVLADGTIAEDRPTEALLADPQHPETQILLAAAKHQPLADLRKGSPS